MTESDATPGQRTYKTLSPEEFSQLVPGDVTIVDVREHREVAGGAISGSINIPLGTLSEHMEKIPLEHPVAVYCRGGGRSARAAQLLADRGYDVLNLDGGYTAYEEYAKRASDK